MDDLSLTGPVRRLLEVCVIGLDTPDRRKKKKKRESDESDEDITKYKSYPIS